jgi:Tfp pilus assembly protein PilN
MKPLVNLSGAPFRNRRLFWLAILALFAIPAYFGLEAIETKTRLDAEIGNYSARVSELERRLKKIEKPSTTAVTISSDKNRQLYAASELVARRAFSWSQLLNDIERNLPPTVRILRISITQIEPEERDGTIGGATSAAVLAMNVIGKSGNDVTAMINKFHDSGRFKVSPISRKAVEGIEDIEFELKVEYFPPASASRANTNNQVAAAQPAGEKK